MTIDRLTAKLVIASLALGLGLISLGLGIGAIHQVRTLKADRDYWQAQAVANANETKVETAEAIGCQEKLQNFYLGSYGKGHGKHHAARRTVPGGKRQKAKGHREP